MNQKLITISAFLGLVALAFSPPAEARKAGASEKFTAYMEFASLASFEAEEKQLSGDTTMEYRFERKGGEVQAIDMTITPVDAALKASCEGNAGCAVQPNPVEGEVTLVPVSFRAEPGIAQAAYSVDIIYN